MEICCTEKNIFAFSDTLEQTILFCEAMIETVLIVTAKKVQVEFCASVIE